MGQFKIVIDAVGGHGQDREKKDGEIVDFKNGGQYETPESIAQSCVDTLKAHGVNVRSAKVYHWPQLNEKGEDVSLIPVDQSGNECITDDLITGIRKGQF